MTSPADPAMPTLIAAEPTPTVTTATATPCPVGDVMRRVQAQLRSGTAPSFEALLAFGEPAHRAS